MFMCPPKMHIKKILMHDMRSNRVSEKTINKVRRDDIAVVYGVMARAVAGLPAEKEAPPFSKLPSPDWSGRKDRSPYVIITARFMNSPLHVLLFDPVAPQSVFQFVKIFTKCKNAE